MLAVVTFFWAVAVSVWAMTICNLGPNGKDKDEELRRTTRTKNGEKD